MSSGGEVADRLELEAPDPPRGADQSLEERVRRHGEILFFDLVSSEIHGELRSARLDLQADLDLIAFAWCRTPAVCSDIERVGNDHARLRRKGLRPGHVGCEPGVELVHERGPARDGLLVIVGRSFEPDIDPILPDTRNADPVSKTHLILKVDARLVLSLIGVPCRFDVFRADGLQVVEVNLIAGALMIALEDVVLLLRARIAGEVEYVVAVDAEPRDIVVRQPGRNARRLREGLCENRIPIARRQEGKKRRQLRVYG